MAARAQARDRVPMPRLTRVLTAAVLLTLAGCSAPEPEPPPATLPPTPADAPFLRQVRSSTGIANPDAELIVLADRACGSIANGSGPLDTADTLETVTGWTGNDAAAFTGASIRAYCPEFADLAR